MKLQNLHGTPGFFVTDGVSFRRLCNCIAEIPGVVFTDRRRFFWGSGDERAEFELNGHAFTITCDGWEADYFVRPRNEASNPPEMEVIREHVAQLAHIPRGLIERLINFKIF